MGQIIDVGESETELPTAVTETEATGYRSGPSLADRPAIDAVADDESVAYVLTNRRQGVTIAGKTTEHVVPDNRYRTVVVVTDRRVIATVGQAEGDRRLTLDIARIADVETTTGLRTGRLTIYRAGEPTWKVHTGTDGIADVADYLRRRSDVCETGGLVRKTTRSAQGMVEATMNTARSIERDGVDKLIPTLGASAFGRADGGGGDQAGAVSATPATGESGAETASPSDTDHLDTETAIDEIVTALARTDWRARSARPKSPFDLLAAREDELVGVVVHCPEDGRIHRETLEHCDAITGAAGTDTVMLATTATVSRADARRAADLGVRLRNVETLADASDPPTIEAVTEMVADVLDRSGWSVRPEAAGPFDLLADHSDELLGVVVHSPEDGTVRSSIEHCRAVTGAAGTDTVMLATTGTVREADERLAEDLGVRLVESDALGTRHVTEIGTESDGA